MHVLTHEHTFMHTHTRQLINLLVETCYIKYTTLKVKVKVSN